MKRNYGPAIRDFTQAIELGESRALYWRALARHADGVEELAREDIHQFLKVYPLEEAKAFMEEIR